MADDIISNNGYSVESLKIIEDGIMPVHHYTEMADSISRWMQMSAEMEQERFLSNVTIVFNFGNEPVLKYSLNSVADKGCEEEQLTSNRLRNEVLFVECDGDKYELSCHLNEKGSSTYRFAKLTPALKFATVNSLSEMKLPLSEDQIEVVAQGLHWSDVEWGADSISISNAGQVSTYNNIRNIQFFKRNSPVSEVEKSAE